MEKIIAVVGYSGSGKTRLIESLVPELQGRGYRVGTVKHSHHDPEFDKKGKDSWRHFNAGAEASAVCGRSLFTLVRRRDSGERTGAEELHSLVQYFEDVDILLAEGFKSARVPKIEVLKKDSMEPPLFPEDDMVFAVVSDSGAELPVPCFSFDQSAEIIETIENLVYRGRV